MRKSYVYLGLASFEGDRFYVKVGKTDHPERRVKTYQTHCPGGLDSMHAVEVKSQAAAFAAEAKLLSRIGALPGARFVGGEWVLVPSGSLESVFEAMTSLVGEPFRVSVERGRRVANWE